MLSKKVEAARIKFVSQRITVKDAKDIIKEAIEKHWNTLAVSCSFGRCSVAVLHMALQIKPDIKVVFDNTWVEYPETYAYRDLLKKEWDLYLIETKPLKSFWQCWNEYGPPMIRRQYYHIKPEKRHESYQWMTGKPACCAFLKEKPFKNACRKYGIKATLTGLRCSESRARMYAIADFSQSYFSKRDRIWKYHPIALWSTQDIKNYFESNHIPMNELYTKYGLERCGCMPCTGFKDWELQLSKTNPKLYEIVQHKMGRKLMTDYNKLQENIDKCDYTQEMVALTH